MLLSKQLCATMVRGMSSHVAGRSKRNRAYSSSLRERQAAQTRELILDAVTTLLGDRRADEMTNRQIADEAGVSERTVYRHFADRSAMLEGLTQRLPEIEDRPSFAEVHLDDLPAQTRRLMELLEQHQVAARAEAVLNADPRCFGVATRQNSEQILAVLARDLPDLDDRDHRRIAAAMRCLGSTQAWLRMREEYGVPGTESGPVVEWVMGLVVRELMSGNTPPAGS
jgi:AcrR family transcriptional regulator